MSDIMIKLLEKLEGIQLEIFDYILSKKYKLNRNGLYYSPTLSGRILLIMVYEPIHLFYYIIAICVKLIQKKNEECKRCGAWEEVENNWYSLIRK